MLQLSSGFKLYFANTSWMMAEKIIRMGVALFVGVYVARYLGPDRFGLLSYAMSLVGLFSAIATLGLEGILIRNLVKDPDKVERLLGTAFVLRVIGALILLILVFLAAKLMSEDRSTIILILIIAGGTLFQAFQVIDFYFQSQVLAKFSSIAQFVALLAASISKLVLIALNASLVWFAWIVVFESLTLGLFLLVLYRKQGMSPLQWSFKVEVAKNLFRDSWPLLFSSMAVMAYMRIDQVMIKEMLGSEAVGNYAVAVTLSEAWYFIPMVVCSSLFPAIINAKKQNETLYYQRLQKLYNLMVLLAVAIALPTTFLAPWVIRVLYGNAFLPAAGVLSIHIWAGVFVFLGVASGKWFLAENFITLSFYRTFLGAIGNVIFNLILIPVLYINGAAISTLLANFLAAYLFDAINSQTRKSFLMKTRSLCFMGVKK